jgi:hypothetical protein
LNSGKFFSKGRARYKSKRKKKGTSDIKKRDERYKKKGRANETGRYGNEKKGAKDKPMELVNMAKDKPLDEF